MKHTPGPWAVIDYDDHDLSVDADELEGCMTSEAIGPKGGDPVCMVVTKGFCNDELHDANRNLISAAPDLLQAGKHLALKLAEVYRYEGLDPRGCQALRSWMDAVGKAEGSL